MPRAPHLALAAILAAATALAALAAAPSRKPPFGTSDIGPGPACVSRCQIACQSISCSGLTPGQCTRARIECSAQCRSRC